MNHNTIASHWEDFAKLLPENTPQHLLEYSRYIFYSGALASTSLHIVADEIRSDEGRAAMLDAIVYELSMFNEETRRKAENGPV